jgi:nicotinamidase-related amidase
MRRSVSAGVFTAAILLAFGPASALLAGSPTPTPAPASSPTPAAVSAASGMQVPPIPYPVAVTLNPATTAFLVLDFQSSSCNPTNRPACITSLTPVAAGIAAARAAGVPVVYSNAGTAQDILEQIAPQPGDARVASGADKFLNTNLDDILKQDGVATVVITGNASNGAVLYTAYEAAARGYTVVIAEDGISANTAFPDLYTEWQLLNAPGTSNPDNTPLKTKAVTLSRTDLITYQ